MGDKLHIEGDHRSFNCPGCNETHSVNSGWGWNESLDRPTFTPSILVTNGDYCSNWKQGDNCWCTFNLEHPDNPVSWVCNRCHSFVTDGRIQYLSDCTHELAGQTIELPDYNDDF